MQNVGRQISCKPNHPSLSLWMLFKDRPMFAFRKKVLELQLESRMSQKAEKAMFTLSDDMGVTSGKERVVTASFCGHRNAILFSYLSMWVGLNSKYSWIYVGFYSIALKQWWLCVKMWRNVSYSNENLLSSLQTSFSLVPKAMSRLVFRDCITVFIWLSPSTAKPSHHTTILNKFWVVFLHKQNGLIRVVLASLCPLQWRPLSNHEESHPRIGAMMAGHRKKATVRGQFDVSGVCAAAERSSVFYDDESLHVWGLKGQVCLHVCVYFWTDGPATGSHVLLSHVCTTNCCLLMIHMHVSNYRC